MYDPSVGKWLSEDPIEFEGGDANLDRYVGNNPTNATDPTGLWTWKISPEGKLLAVAEKGDSLSTLTRQGYDAQTIIKIAKLAGQTQFVDIKGGESLDISALLPDSAMRALRIQQTLDYEEIRAAVNRTDGKSDKKVPKGRTVGNCGLDLAMLYVQNKTEGGIRLSANEFGLGQCHGFTALMLGAKMPPKHDPREFSLGLVKGKDDDYYEQKDLDQARPPGLEVLKTFRSHVKEVWYTPEEGTVGYLTKGRKVTTKPDFGSIALFWNEGKLWHSAFVLGTSRNGDVYLIQKLNEGEPIVMTTASSPVLAKSGKPKYYNLK